MTLARYMDSSNLALQSFSYHSAQDGYERYCESVQDVSQYYDAQVKSTNLV